MCSEFSLLGGKNIRKHRAREEMEELVKAGNKISWRR